MLFTNLTDKGVYRFIDISEKYPNLEMEMRKKKGLMTNVSAVITKKKLLYFDRQHWSRQNQDSFFVYCSSEAETSLVFQNFDNSF